MPSTEPSPLSIALAYHSAWTGHDLDRAMGYIAEEIATEAPSGAINGAASYRAFLGGFMQQLTGVETIAAFGDDTTAVLVYYPHTPATTHAPTAEHFTVAGGKINRTVLIFDRPSFAPSSTDTTTEVPA